MSHLLRLLAVLLVGLPVLTAACGVPKQEAGQVTPGTGVPPPGAPTTEEAKPLTVRDKGEGGVTLEATPATREYLEAKQHPKEHIGFIVKLDSGRADLMEYDLVSLSLLRDHLGRETPAIGWDPLSDAPGHRSGLLLFSARGRDGQRTIRPAGFLQLVVRNLAGVEERVLRWTPPLFPGEKC